MIAPPVKTYPQLLAAIEEAQSKPEVTLRRFCDERVRLEDNLTCFHAEGDRTPPANLILEFSEDARLNFGRNVRKLQHTDITNEGGHLCFKLENHGNAPGSLVWLRTNAPLPWTGQWWEHETRLRENHAYVVLPVDKDRFKLAKRELPDAPLKFGGVNICEVSVFRAIGPGDINTATNTIVCPNHGLKDGMRWGNVREKGVTWEGGPPEGRLDDRARAWVRNATQHSFQLSQNRLGPIMPLTGKPTGPVMFCGSFEADFQCILKGDTQIFEDYVCGQECALDKEPPGNPAIWGSFGGLPKQAKWWGVIATIPKNYVQFWSGNGLAKPNVALPDCTEALQAAIRSHVRVWKHYANGPGDSNRYFDSQWYCSPLELDGGIIRVTQRARIFRVMSVAMRGKNQRSTMIMWDLWKGGPNGDVSHTDSGPAYMGLMIEGGATQSLCLEDFSMLASIRFPAHGAILGWVGGGGSDDCQVNRVQMFGGSRYSLWCGGASVTHHPVFTSCSAGHLSHPYCSAVKTFGRAGAQNLGWKGGTINQGSLPFLFAGFELSSQDDIDVEDVHFEQCFHSFYLDSGAQPVRLTGRKQDATANTHDALCIPAGNNQFDLYPVTAGEPRSGLPRKLAAPNFAVEGEVTLKVGAGHLYTKGELCSLWNTDGLKDGLGKSLDGLHNLKAVGVDSITIPITGKGSGALTREAWVASNWVVGNRWYREGCRWCFQSTGPGAGIPFEGLKPDFGYILEGGQCLAFDWEQMIKDGEWLAIDFPVPHKIATGTPLWWVPSRAGGFSNTNMPTGINYNRGCFWAEAVTTKRLRLYLDKAMTQRVPFPEDFSKVAGNFPLGDESVYYLVSSRYRLALTRKDMKKERVVAIPAGPPRLMSLVYEQIAVVDSNVLLEMKGQRMNSKARSNGQKGRRPAMMYSSATEIIPEQWAAMPADNTYANLEGIERGKVPSEIRKDVAVW